MVEQDRIDCKIENTEENRTFPEKNIQHRIDLSNIRLDVLYTVGYFVIGYFIREFF